MKILVLSDSHSALSFMRQCIDAVRPDQVIHLGDYYGDGQAMEQEYPHIRFLLVPGNCDNYRVGPEIPQVRSCTLEGLRIYMTHGHNHQVKSSLHRLAASARNAGAQVALFGHTHSGYCNREEDGLLLLNPGSCGYFGGSAGYLELENGTIKCCRLLRQEDLEAFK